MPIADDHKTWISTAAVVAPRLRLRSDTPVRSILDGAWWPRSREPVTELTALVTALDLRHTPVVNVMLNAQAWDTHPRRIRVAERVIRLGWFATLDADLLIATTGDNHRVDLLLVSPATTPVTADVAMGMAADGAPTLRPADIMAAATTHSSGQSSAEAVENEG